MLRIILRFHANCLIVVLYLEIFLLVLHLLLLNLIISLEYFDVFRWVTDLLDLHLTNFGDYSIN